MVKQPVNRSSFFETADLGETKHHYQRAVVEDTKKEILLIFTGGTFLSRDVEGLGQHVGSDSSQENIEKTIKYFEEKFKFDSADPYNIDSSDLVPDNRVQLVNLIKEHNNYDGYVIVHGTDTMEYTSSILPFMIQGVKKPIIITGSMISIEEEGTDAPHNLSKALLAANCDELSSTYVVFADKLLQGNKTRKVNATVLDAFSSLDYPSVGLFRELEGSDGNQIPDYGLWLHQDLTKDIQEIVDKQEEKISTTLATEVEVCKLTPSTNLDIFDYYIEKGVKGIIIEGYGDGNVPSYDKEISDAEKVKRGNQSANILPQERGRQLLTAIKKCVNNGIHIVLKSQCVTGKVQHAYTGGKRLREEGVMSSGNMTTPTAYAKLMYLLKNHDTSVKGEYNIDIAGEQKDGG